MTNVVITKLNNFIMKNLTLLAQKFNFCSCLFFMAKTSPVAGATVFHHSVLLQLLENFVIVT